MRNNSYNLFVTGSNCLQCGQKQPPFTTVYFMKEKLPMDKTT